MSIGSLTYEFCYIQSLRKKPMPQLKGRVTNKKVGSFWIKKVVDFTYTSKNRAISEIWKKIHKPVTMEGLGNILSQTCFSESCPLKGPAHSKNENLYFLVPAKTKRMQPILVSRASPLRSNLKKKTLVQLLVILLVQWGSWPSLYQCFFANCS